MGRQRSERSEERPALFELPPPSVEPAPVDDELRQLGERMPRGIRLGTMSWSYPGWKGLVYGASATQEHLSAHGLTAYGKHPLLRAAEIDRAYYEPLSAEAFRALAAQVPDDFRFVVKAHEDCVVVRFPSHARYGKKKGEPNPRYLDASYASDAAVAPAVDGLGSKLGALLFQFPPQDAGEPRAFAAQLRAFLERLPRGVPYAVELRNPELLTPSYAEALAAAGAVHCHNVWTVMPELATQAKLIPPRARSPLLIRWLLRPGDSYEDARARCAPFHRIVEEDRANRARVADLAERADHHGVPVLLLVDNKAEGCAPESIARLARAIVDRRGSRAMAASRTSTGRM